MPQEGSTFDKFQPVRSVAFYQALLVEFVGTMMFQFLGGSAPGQPVLGALANGFSLSVLVYLSANVSGGHLNPAVTFSTFVSGNYPGLHSLFYAAVQILGAIAGSLVAAEVYPNAEVGGGGAEPGCPPTDEEISISKSQLFGWELMMTFVLIGTVYACGIAQPGHGSFTPLAVGMSLTACAAAGGRFSGAFLNPARVLGPSVVFSCWDLAWVFVMAQFAASVAACILFVSVYGWGPLSPFAATPLGSWWDGRAIEGACQQRVTGARIMAASIKDSIKQRTCEPETTITTQGSGASAVKEVALPA